MSEVDMRGNCSKCGGTHYGSGNKCVYTDEEIRKMNEDERTFKEVKALGEMADMLGPDTAHKDEIAQAISGGKKPMIQAHMIGQSIDHGPIMCIYHSPCQDGFTAAWAMRHLMPKANIEFIPAKYGDAPPDVTGRIVYILDFSYSREVIHNMLLMAQRLLILDHHESALKNLVGLDAAPEEGGTAASKYSDGMNFWMSDRGHIVLDMSRSGAGMAWDYFAQIMKDPLRDYGKKRPQLLNHVEDRDLWKFEYPETKNICASLFSHEQDFSIWEHLMSYDKRALESMRDEGEGIMRKQMKDIRELLLASTRDFVIAGHKVPCANIPYTLSSEGCHELLAQYPEAPFAASYMDMAHGRVFSLRSEDSRVNVSEVAMKFTYKGTRGGGHRKAAGFTMPIGWEGDEYAAD